MIHIKQIAQKVQERLNQNASELNTFFDNAHFEFIVHQNSGEYKRATRDEGTNVIKYYINAVMKVISSDVDSESGESVDGMYNASMTTSIEFLIPFAESGKLCEGGSVVKFGELAHYVISSALEQGMSDDIVDDGQKYLVGSKFNIPATGSKDIRLLADESITFTVYGSHFIVASGVSSRDIRLKINDEHVSALRVGVARRSVTDGNVIANDSSLSAKNTSSLSAKNTISATALTVVFDVPMRTGGYCESIRKYLLSGEIEELTVNISIPTTTEGENEEYEYTMAIADAGLNGQMNLAASLSVRLVEYWAVGGS